MTERPADATEKRRRLRALLARDELVVMPGGCTPLYAMMAERAGFEAFFLAGSQVAALQHGLPDCGLIGLSDVADEARKVAARTELPVLVDADTGYGNAVNVFHAVQELVRAGVAAVQIEDQEAPKKSGTLAGRRCVPLDEAVGKVQAAVAARDEIDPAFVICARTDAIGAEGTDFDDALARCDAYARDGGADLVWLNSVQTREQLARACATLPVGVVALWGGQPPPPTVDELARLGCRVALFPTLASRAAAQAAWEELHALRDGGEPALRLRAERADASPAGRAPIATLIGADRVRELEASYVAADAQRDYVTTFGHRPS